LTRKPRANGRLDASARRLFADLFTGCHGDLVPRDDDREAFLVTLQVCAGDGADLTAVHRILVDAREQRLADRTRARLSPHAAARRSRVRKAAAKLQVALEEMIELHEANDPHRLAPELYQPYRHALEWLTSASRVDDGKVAGDWLVQHAAPNPVGPPTRPWLKRIKADLSRAGVKPVHCGDLLRQLGLF
jgi:hypothetical protein